jgi:GNAT superfamily N-acetyltransferase
MIEQLTDIYPVTLRDGRTVVIRPLDAGDRAALTAFGHALPQDDLRYFPDDLQCPEAFARLVKPQVAAPGRQFVAVAGHMIVGYGALRCLAGCSCDVAEIDLVVSAGWRRSGLGKALAGAILDAARDLELTQVVAEMLVEHVARRAIFERLGFSIEGVLEGLVCDQYGRHYDLLVMAYQIDYEQRGALPQVVYGVSGAGYGDPSLAIS